MAVNTNSGEFCLKSAELSNPFIGTLSVAIMRFANLADGFPGLRLFMKKGDSIIDVTPFTPSSTRRRHYRH